MDFEELYQDIILDHSRKPRNFGDLPDANFHAHGDNPLCGDEVTVHVKLGPQDELEKISFTGNGCSICMASASMMTAKMKQKSRAESEQMIRHFQQMLTAEPQPPPDTQLGDLRALEGVRKFPLRVKCATLPWHALEQALRKPPSHETHFSVDADSA